MTSTAAPAYLIDASIYIFRYYFSMPLNWWAENGCSTAAVYGYSTWLLRFLSAQKPQAIAVCFDESLETCFRNQIYPDYKISRALPDEALAFQLQACKYFTELMGIPTYASSTHEADDLLATLAQRCHHKMMPVCIVSRDKDLAQIIRAGDIGLWDALDGELLDYSAIQKKMGVRPEQVADFLALVGDSSDDIPGVPGVGVKTAAILLSHFDSWQALQNNLHLVAQLPLRGAARVAQSLDSYRAQIDLALLLTTVVNRAPLGRRFSIIPKQPNKVQLKEYAASLGLGKNFNTTLNRVVTNL